MSKSSKGKPSKAKSSKGKSSKGKSSRGKSSESKRSSSLGVETDVPEAPGETGEVSESTFSRLWHVAAVAILLVAVGVVFGQVLSFDFLGYDDPIYIGNWPTTKIIQEGLSVEGMKWIWTADEASLWEPLTYLSHMLDVEWFGCKPTDGGDHHWMNLLLHAANVLLVYALGVALFRQPVVSLIAAGLFGLHPMRAESVGWISERKGLLCACFMLLALLSYVRHARAEAAGSDRKSWLWASLLLTVLAMMSKPAAIVVPLLVGMLDIYPLRRCGFANDSWKFGQVIVAQLREKWAFVLAAMGLMLVSIGIQYGSNTEKFSGAMSAYERVSLIPAVLMFYLQRTFLPQNLNFEYPSPDSQFYVLGAVVLVIALTWFALDLYRKQSGLFFAWGWFLASLFPVCGLVYVGTSFTTDRYTYFAHIGLFLGISAQIAHWFRGQNRETLRTAATVLGLALMAVSAFASHRQTAVWRGDESLYRSAIAAQPEMLTGYTNLATMHDLSGETKQAIEILERLYDERKGKVDYTTLYNMACMYDKLAADPANGIEPNRQIKFYEMALQASGFQHKPSLHNYGKLIMESAQNMEEGDKKKNALHVAHGYLIKASEGMNHESPLYLNTLAKSCMVQSDWERAKQCVERALQLPFDFPALREQLLKKRGEIDRVMAAISP